VHFQTERVGIFVTCITTHLYFYCAFWMLVCWVSIGVQVVNIYYVTVTVSARLKSA